VHISYAIHYRDEKMDAGTQSPLIFSKTFNDKSLPLGHHTDSPVGRRRYIKPAIITTWQIVNVRIRKSTEMELRGLLLTVFYEAPELTEEEILKKRK
jgi:hypothetical protein